MKNKKKRAAVVGDFIKKHYGITMRDILGKFRESLLEDIEEVPCNLCGSSDRTTVAERDKYGLPVQTVMCKQCGLLYLCPRPSSSSYANFYESGGTDQIGYHMKINPGVINALLREYFGPDFTPRHTADDVASLTSDEKIRKAKDIQTYDQYGRDILKYLSDVIPRGSRVFEVGASRGQLLIPWRDIHDCEISGVEPKVQSVCEALENYGIKLFQGFSDNPLIPLGYYDLVNNIRTINHMLDPLSELKRARTWLKDDGYIFIDIQDSVRKAEYRGFTRNIVEIDHPYMFTLNTLSAMVQKAGFELVRAEHVDVSRIYNAGKGRADNAAWQIRILGRKTSSVTDCSYPDTFEEASALIRSTQRYTEQLIEKKKNITEKRTRSEGKRAMLETTTKNPY